MMARQYIRLKEKFRGWLKDKARRIRKYPKLSTYIASSFLSIVWLLAWLIIFFLSTWLIDITTGTKGFILALWLAVVAESVIRYVENLDGIAFFSKPNQDRPKGDNKDFTFMKMMLLLFIGMSFAFFFQFLSSDAIAIFESTDTLFVGQKIPGRDGFICMINAWSYTLLHDGQIGLALVLSFLFRIAIYKRSPNSSEVKED
tara:strand:- start:116 stop:718 length:603 start_codon:yes stop_codon:yes gene_type:complete